MRVIRLGRAEHLKPRGGWAYKNRVGRSDIACDNQSHTPHMQRFPPSHPPGMTSQRPSLASAKDTAGSCSLSTFMPVHLCVYQTCLCFAPSDLYVTCTWFMFPICVYTLCVIVCALCCMHYVIWFMLYKRDIIARSARSEGLGAARRVFLCSLCLTFLFLV